MKIHVVQKGDTLWELAKQYDVDFEELKQSNPQLSSPDMIMPGMKIKIPSSAKSVQKEESKETKESQKSQNPEVVHPYKEMQQPKPMPMMQEDEKEKQKPVQPHMPMQPQKPKEQQKKPPEPQLPEQPQLPKQPQLPEQPHMQEPTPQITNQQVQPVIQMPIMEQELKNYNSVQLPEMPQYQKQEEQPEEHKKPIPQPMYQPPMPQPVAMIPVCCQMMPPPGAMPMPHQQLPMIPSNDHGCGPIGYPGSQQGYPHPYYEHGMMMESSSIEMPVKPSLMNYDNDCGCKDKKTMPTYHSNQQEMHHHPHYHTQPHQFEFPSTDLNHLSGQPQSYPPYYGALPNPNPFPTPPVPPYFSGTGYREEEDETSGE